MKTLKKISLAVLVLAAVVATVVITALAAGDDGSYTGTVEEANAKLTAVSGMATDAAKSEALIELKAYTETVDPESEGFEDFAKNYNTAAYGVLWNLILASDAVDASGSLNDKTYTYMAVYGHISKAEIFAEYADDALLARWENAKSIYSEKTFEVAKAWLAIAEADKSAENAVYLYNYITGAPVVSDDAEGFDEIAEKYNSITLYAVNELLKSAPATAEGFNSVLEAHKKAPVLEDYMTDAAEEALEKFEADFDKKLVDALTASLALITDEATAAVNTADLKALYDFIAAVALFDASNDDYAALVKAVNEKSFHVAKRYYAEVEKVVGAEGSTEIPEFRKAVNALLGFLKDAPSIIYRETYSVDFSGTVAEAQALLDAVVADDYKTFAPLYAYLSKTPIDPLKEGAAKLYADYEAARAKASESLLAKLATVNPEGADFAAELASIMEISKYLQNTPVSLEAVNTYNEKLHGFTIALKADFDGSFSALTSVKAALDAHLELCPIDETKLSAESGYAAFVEKVAVVNGYEAIKEITALIYNSEEDAVSLDKFREPLVTAINEIMAAALLDYDELINQKVEATGTGRLDVVQSMMQELNDADSIEAKKTIYANIYLYLKENPINEKLDGYDLFLGDFEAAAEEITDYIVAGIVTIEDMELAREYLTKTPVSKEAIEGYNSKYLFVYRDTLKSTLASYSEASKALHSFLETPENAAAVEAVDGLKEALGNYELIEVVALTQVYNLIYLDDSGTSISVIPRGNAVRTLKAYANTYPINEDVFGAKAALEGVEKASADYDEVLERARQELDNQAPFEQYNYNGYSYSVNWDEGTNPFTFSWSDNETGKNTGTHWEMVKDEKNGGYYWKTVYGNRTDQGQSYSGAFWGRTGIDSTRGIVMEFDVKGDDLKGIQSVYFRRIEYPNRNSSGFFAIDNNKVYPYFDGKKQSTPLIEDDVITPGEWTHFIMIFFPDEQQVSLYVDYQLLGKWSCKGSDFTVFTELRVQGSAMDDVICYDNFNLYQGTYFRIRDKFESMTPEDKFRYYVDYMCNENYTPTARLTAYQEATALYPEFADNPEFKEYADKYHSVDVEADIVIPTREVNLALLKSHTAVIQQYLDSPALITSVNSAEIQADIDIIDNFIAINSAYIDQASSEFTSILAKLNAAKTQMERCATLKDFIKALNYFERAFSHSAKTRHYATAMQLYDKGDFRSADVRASLAQDPAVIEFELAMNGELNQMHPDYVDIFEYYDRCSSVLDTQKVYENSKKIIDCLSFITEMKDYEATEEFFEENYDYIAKYMNIIRDLLNSGNYDPAYSGVDAAIAEFREMDVYFYEQLQLEHEAALAELVEQYPLVSSYIEKLGICSSIESYLSANDVDASREVIAELITKYNAYRTELDSFAADYKDVLAENTEYFINITERMKAYVDYASLKALYDEGAIYYYEMNADSDAAQAAIAVFEAYGKQLETVEEASAMFVGYADDIKAARNDGKLYEALVNCSKYLDDVSAGCEGAEKALETYEKALKSYNDKYLPCNAEIEEANTVVCSLRTNVIAEAVLSVIAAIFNK